MSVSMSVKVKVNMDDNKSTHLQIYGVSSKSKDSKNGNKIMVGLQWFIEHGFI
jgi:hypothetical protein